MPRKVNGFITLHRQILDWEWYKNINTKVLFLHLLLKANYKDLSFEGRKILRGQLVTSLASLSSELGLSVHQIRVSLDKLIMTGEVTSKSYNRYRIITIVKYDEYQNDDNQNDSQVTSELASEWQADGKQMASKWQQVNNITIVTKEQWNKVTIISLACSTNSGLPIQGRRANRKRKLPLRRLSLMKYFFRKCWIPLRDGKQQVNGRMMEGDMFRIRQPG